MSATAGVYPRYRNCLPFKALVPLLEQWEREQKVRLGKSPKANQEYSPIQNLSIRAMGRRESLTRMLCYVRNDEPDRTVDFDVADRIVTESYGPMRWQFDDLRDLYYSIELDESKGRAVFMGVRKCNVCHTEFEWRMGNAAKQTTCSQTCSRRWQDMKKRQRRTQ